MWATLLLVHISTGVRAPRSMTACSDANWRGDNLPIGKHGADLNRQVRIDAVPHTVPSTHAGALFQALPTPSMCGRACDGGSASPAVRVCALPRSGADLQLLRSRPDL